jgi:hypothetical protein
MPAEDVNLKLFITLQYFITKSFLYIIKSIKLSATSGAMRVCLKLLEIHLRHIMLTVN